MVLLGAYRLHDIENYRYEHILVHAIEKPQNSM